jgi:hypothetical protein
VETESCLFRREFAELNIFLHLRVAVRDAPVGVTDPEPQQILRHSLLAKMSHTVSPEGMEAPPRALCRSDMRLLSGKLLKAPDAYLAFGARGLDAGKYFWRSGREKCFSLDCFNRTSGPE